MNLALEIVYDKHKKAIYCKDQSTIDTLRSGNIGTMSNGTLKLAPEEALYVLDVRKAVCKSSDSGDEITFNGLASYFSKNKKFMARYFTYKDWRDRGLMIRSPKEEHVATKNAQMQIKRYPSSSINISNYSMNGVFFEDDLTSVVDDPEMGKQIYEQYWFGQYGTYKLSNHGTLNKFDLYETLFLVESGSLKIESYQFNEILKIASRVRPDAQKLYEVYKHWRSKGYVIKSGFKFGTHFRVYFPGAKPIKDDPSWIHSKHVLHVFPRDSKLLTSEWARVIRVAHSVKKTFILGIPGKTRQKKVNMDFILYHRKHDGIEIPGKDAPHFGMLSLGENEYIGGSELSAMINEANSEHMELIIAIADRETAVTYYRVKKIELPTSEYEYYEIDWMQP